MQITNGAGTDVTTSPAVSTPFAFTNREFDRESRLYYYRARYYDPSLGRFLQQDPELGSLDMPSTINSRYIAALNNPIRFTDPSGRIAPVVIAAIVGAVLGGTLAALQGQNILEGVIIGAAAGASGFAAAPGAPLAAAAVGSAVGGLTGGLLNVINGRSFSGGFVNGAFIGFVAGLGGGIVGAGSSGAIPGLGNSNLAFSRQTLCNIFLLGGTAAGGTALGVAAVFLPPVGVVAGGIGIIVGAAGGFTAGAGGCNLIGA